MLNIVFIHGMWSAGWDSPATLDFFSEQGYHCHAPMLRHHEKSAQQALAGTSLHDYVDDLSNLINNLDSAPILFGHSMGGLLAQLLAARHECRALILSSTAPPAGIVNLYPSVLRTFAPIMFTPGFWNKAFPLDYKAACYSVYNGLDTATTNSLYHDLSFESGRAIFEIGMWPLDKTRAARVDFAKVNCPIMMASGADDRITPQALHKNIRKKYPHAIFKSYPQGHSILHSSSAETMRQDVLNWLQLQGL